MLMYRSFHYSLSFNFYIYNLKTIEVYFFDAAL